MCRFRRRAHGHGDAGSRHRDSRGPDLTAASDGNIIGLIGAISEILAGNREATLAGSALPDTRALLQRQHAIDTALPLPEWCARDIPRQLRRELRFLERGAQAAPSVPILTSRSPGFWKFMRSITGRFERVDARVSSPATSIGVGATRVSVWDGSPHILQPVVVVTMDQDLTGAMAVAPTVNVVAHTQEPVGCAFDGMLRLRCEALARNLPPDSHGCDCEVHVVTARRDRSGKLVLRVSGRDWHGSKEMASAAIVKWLSSEYQPAAQTRNDERKKQP